MEVRIVLLDLGYRGTFRYTGRHQVKRGDGRVKPSKRNCLCNVEFKLWYSLPSGHRGAKKSYVDLGRDWAKPRKENLLRAVKDRCKTLTWKVPVWQVAESRDALGKGRCVFVMF